MSNKRIAIFARFLEDGGGLERVILHLVKGFTARGYPVDLILYTAEGPFMQYIPEEVHVIDLGSPGLLASIPKLVTYLKQEKPAVMYCAETDRGFAGVIAKVLAMSRTPIMIGIHTFESWVLQANLDLKARLLEIVKRIISPFATTIIPVSHGLVDILMKEFRISRKKIQVIHNPVVSEKLKQLMQEPIEHRWLKNKTLPVLIATGRLIPLKGYEELLYAVKDVMSQCEVRLIILGEGPFRPKLTALIQELELEEYVDLPGFVDNPYAYMKNADLFVLSSRFEGFGNVLVEAMACGCPVVSTDCPAGPAEILENGKYGALVPVEDANALGQAILEALQQRHDISALQQRAEDFSEDKIVDEYLRVFQV